LSRRHLEIPLCSASPYAIDQCGFPSAIKTKINSKTLYSSRKSIGRAEPSSRRRKRRRIIKNKPYDICSLYSSSSY